MGWNDSLQLQLFLEGWNAFSNRPTDAGGATYAGLTLHDMQLQDPVLAGKFPHLSNDEVANYYYKFYWIPIHGAETPEPADAVLFQMSCNLGPRHAIMALQAALLITPDGTYGPETISRVRFAKGSDLADKLLATQLMYYAAGDNEEKRGLIDRVMKVLKSDAYQGKTRLDK